MNEKKKNYVTQSQPLAFKAVTFTLHWLVSFLCNWCLFFFGGRRGALGKGDCVIHFVDKIHNSLRVVAFLFSFFLRPNKKVGIEPFLQGNIINTMGFTAFFFSIIR